MSTITGVVTHIERKGHTYYGNPITIIELRDDEAADGEKYSSIRITDNASLVYEISNADFREERHTFQLTRAGRISHVVK